MATKEDNQTRASSSQSNISIRSCPFIDRHKILAAACEKYQELHFPDEVREWIKEIERIDDYTERIIDEIKQLQIEEQKYKGTSNHKELRSTQIKLREQLRRLKIIVEQKTEINTKLERFLHDFNAKLPIVYAHVETNIPNELPLDNNKILVTPEIKKHNYEVLQKRQEFAEEQLKLEKRYVEANEAKELDPIEDDSTNNQNITPSTQQNNNRGRRSNVIPSPQKKVIRNNTISPKKKKTSNVANNKEEGKQTKESPKNKEKPKQVEEENTAPPPEKKARTPNLPPITPPVTRGSHRRRTLTKKNRESIDDTSKSRIQRTPEQLAAQKEQRVQAQIAREERLTLQRIVQDGNRRAAATAADSAIHNIQQTRGVNASKQSPPKQEKRSYTRRSDKSKEKVKEEVDEAKTEDEERYCYCDGISYGQMIACDNDDCQIVWFHFGCVNLKIKPKKGFSWFCPDCRGEKSYVKKSD